MSVVVFMVAPKKDLVGPAAIEPVEKAVNSSAVVDISAATVRRE